MRKISVLDRILLLFTVFLASHQVVTGIEGLNPLAIYSFTIGFGVMVVAGLMLLIMGFEILDNSAVIMVVSLIPLSLSLGLAAQFLPAWRTGWLIFSVLGFLGLGLSRFFTSNKTSLIVLVIVHGLSGLMITFLPILLSLQGKTAGGFMLVGLGGALVSIFGLLLASLRAGKALLPARKIYAILPGLHLLAAALFVIGFKFI